ncbi:uncharacterized protein YidB (DUF937 family) [Bradyrhizobium sp. LB9.1b]
MSRGMPSMTALLGMLAIAGYQNRDKLADMSRHATSGQPAGAKDSLSGMLGNLGGVGSLLHGGIGELLEHFKQNGQGDAAQSWINQGPNREVTPPELQQAIGPDVLQKRAADRPVAARDPRPIVSRTSDSRGQIHA